MQLDMVKVVFRKETDGRIMALFPEESYMRNKRTLCFSFEEEHFEADCQHIITHSVPATEEEYAPLLRLLTHRYGKVKVLKKCFVKFK